MQDWAEGDYFLAFSGIVAITIISVVALNAPWKPDTRSDAMRAYEQCIWKASERHKARCVEAFAEHLDSHE